MSRRIRKSQIIGFDADAQFLGAVEWRPIANLIPLAHNPRTHSKKQVRQIAESIETFGWVNPVLIDAEGQIIAGHGRVAAAKLLGMESVPTLLVSHMTDEQKRAFVIADNRLAELAGWDVAILGQELQFLTSVDLDFDATVIGFETAEIDLAIERLDAAEVDEADELPERDPATPPISRRGDLWLLGSHRLLCGDARDPTAHEIAVGERRARMVFTDPPYNVPIDGHVCGLGRIRHDDFVMASGELSNPQFRGFLATFLRQAAAVCSNGALLYVCIDWRHLIYLLEAARDVGLAQLNLVVWNKTNAGMGSFYRSRHELIPVFKSGDAPHANNVQLGRYGRNRPNVWTYAGVNSLRAGRLEELRMHPTVKPLTMVTDAIKDASHRGDVVLDPFCGSGTTIIAAEKTGRRAAAIEIDPTYVDTAIGRWQTYCGKEAIHAETGMTYTDLAALRADSELNDRSKAQEAIDAR